MRSSEFCLRHALARGPFLNMDARVSNVAQLYLLSQWNIPMSKAQKDLQHGHLQHPTTSRSTAVFVKHVTCQWWPVFSSKSQTNRSNMLHRTKKRGPLWTEHGTQWIALSVESCCPSNETLPKMLGWLGAAWTSRTNQEALCQK